MPWPFPYMSEDPHEAPLTPVIYIVTTLITQIFIYIDKQILAPPRNTHTVARSLYSEDATVEETTSELSEDDNSFKTSSPSEFNSTEAERGNKTYHH